MPKRKRASAESAQEGRSKLYVSDTHFRHAKIIEYCNRPFASVEEMDLMMFDALLSAEASGAELYHLGDFAYNPELAVDSVGRLQAPERHTLIAGNHDKLATGRFEQVRAYRAWFGRIIGTESTWQDNHLLVEDTLEGRKVRLLLSHRPQQDMRGAHFNLYGHCHNGNQRRPENIGEFYAFLVHGSEKHINVSVELNGYRPQSLEDLVRRKRAGEWLI